MNNSFKYALVLLVILLASTLVISCGGEADTTTTLVDTTTEATMSTADTTTAIASTTTTAVKVTTASKMTTKLTTVADATTVFTFPTVTPSGTQRPKDEVTPIIIIPGIMGSQLSDSVGNILWPADISSAGMQKLSQLHLENGASNITSVSLAPVAQALVNPAIHIGSNDTYRELASALAAEFGANNVYFFGYDWRQDLPLSAIELYKFIEQVKYTSNDDKVNIVAHSMGGLVLTSYLSLCNDQGRATSIDTAVTAGTPFYGAEKATAVVGGYGDFLKDYVNVDQIISSPAGSVMLDTISDLIIGLAKSYPSIYTMIPSASYEKLDTEMRTAAGVKGRVTADWLTSKYTSAFASVEHYNLVGTRKNTLSVITPAGSESYVDGDGTVSYASAVGAFEGATKSFNGIDHGKLVESPDALNYIVGCFK